MAKELDYAAIVAELKAELGITSDELNAYQVKAILAAYIARKAAL